MRDSSERAGHAAWRSKLNSNSVSMFTVEKLVPSFCVVPNMEGMLAMAFAYVLLVRKLVGMMALSK